MKKMTKKLSLRILDFFKSDRGNIFVRSLQKGSATVGFLLILEALAGFPITMSNFLIAVPPIGFAISFSVDLASYLHERKLKRDKKIIEDTIAVVDSHSLRPKKWDYHNTTNKAEEIFTKLKQDKLITNIEKVVTKVNWKALIGNKEVLQALYRSLNDNNLRGRSLYVLTTVVDTFFAMISSGTAIFAYYLIYLTLKNQEKDETIVTIIFTAATLIAIYAGVNNITLSRNRFHELRNERLSLDKNIDILFSQLDRKNKSKLTKEILELLNIWHEYNKKIASMTAVINNSPKHEKHDALKKIAAFFNSQIGSLFLMDLGRSAGLVGFILSLRVLGDVDIVYPALAIAAPPFELFLLFGIDLLAYFPRETLRKDKQNVNETITVFDRNLMERSQMMYQKTMNNVRHMFSGKAQPQMLTWKTQIEKEEVVDTLTRRIQRRNEKYDKATAITGVVADTLATMLGSVTAIFAFYLICLIVKHQEKDENVATALFVIGSILSVYAGINTIFQSRNNIANARKEKEKVCEDVDYLCGRLNSKDRSKQTEKTLSILSMWAEHRPPQTTEAGNPDVLRRARLRN